MYSLGDVLTGSPLQNRLTRVEGQVKLHQTAIATVETQQQAHFIILDATQEHTERLRRSPNVITHGLPEDFESLGDTSFPAAKTKGQVVHVLEAIGADSPLLVISPTSCQHHILQTRRLGYPRATGHRPVQVTILWSRSKSRMAPVSLFLNSNLLLL